MYIPLHHKYRPQTFQQLVGQAVIATTLSNGVRTGRIAPAYMFTGPRGTGKTSSARILAKALNCQSTDKPTPEPCGVCALCQAITQGNALDIIEIDAASHTGVDNVREMIEKAQFAPVQARYKVFIIDECHMLSGAAFNALLKTLEEPPERVVFVLATTDPQRVPATIISRCQRFDFRRIAQADMEAHLRQIAEQEGIEITPAALTLVAQLAQGGMRDAESLLDQLSLLPPPIQPEQVWQLAGRVPERDLLELVQGIYTEPLMAVLQRGRALLERGWEPLQLYQQLVGFVRDGLIALTAPQERHLTTLMPDTWQAWQTLGERITATDLLHAQEYLRQSEPQLRHTTQPHLWLEVTLLGWWHLWQEKTASATPAPASAINSSSIAKASPAPAITSSTPAINSSEPAIPSPASANNSSLIAKTSSDPAIASSPLPTPPPTPVVKSLQPAIDSPSSTIDSSPAATTSPSSEIKSPSQAIPSSKPAVHSSPTATGTTLETQDLATLWARVVAHIKKPPARSLFQEASLVKLANQHAEIALKTPALLRNAEGKIKEVQAAFKQVLAQPITITLTVPKGNAPPISDPPVSNTVSHNSNNNNSNNNAHHSSVQAPVPATPPERPSLPAIPSEDGVMVAARRLADFFQGEVIVPVAEEGEDF